MSLINTPPCSETQDNLSVDLKKLSIDILKKYASKEKNCHNPAQYYSSLENECLEQISKENECSKQISKFDKLSNEFKIGVKSRLNHIQASVVLAIFKSLYENCFWFFNKQTGSFIFADLELTESDLSNLYEKYDADTWIKYLEQYITELFDEIEMLDDEMSVFGSTYISKELPSLNAYNKYIGKNFGNKNNLESQYFTVEELINKYEKSE